MLHAYSYEINADDIPSIQKLLKSIFNVDLTIRIIKSRKSLDDLFNLLAFDEEERRLFYAALCARNAALAQNLETYRKWDYEFRQAMADTGP